MKKIIFTRTDGGLSVLTPAAGARLAFFVTLEGGAQVPPAPEGETEPEYAALPVDGFLGAWPKPGATATWAETEDEFVERIAASDVPVTLREPYLHPQASVPVPMMLRRTADALGLQYTETPFQIIDESALPADRTFRNAWRAGVATIEHDMGKCREIHRDRMREARAPKLAALDTNYLRADEQGDATAKAAIAQQKQALRDVTADPAIDAARTPEELKAVWPPALDAAVSAQASEAVAG